MLGDYQVQDATVLKVTSMPLRGPTSHFTAVVCDGDIIYLSGLEDRSCTELIADHILFQQQVLSTAERQRGAKSG